MDVIKIFLFLFKNQPQNHFIQDGDSRSTFRDHALPRNSTKILFVLIWVVSHFMLPGWTLCFLEIQLWKVKNCHLRVKIIIKYFTIFSNFSVFNKVLNRGNFVLTKRSKIVLNNNNKLLVLHNHNLWLYIVIDSNTIYS